MSTKQTIRIQKVGRQTQKQRDFYKGLEEKYINAKNKSSYSSIKQSRNIEKQRQSLKNNRRKNTVKQGKDKQSKSKNVQNYLHLPSFDDVTQLQNKIREQYNFDLSFTDPLQCCQSIRNISANEKLKFVCINLNSITTTENPLTFQTKTQSLSSYIQPLAHQFQKVTICMYSLSNSQSMSGKVQFYDMLSIRRQIKTDTKLLIQTKICNNSKSSVILKKLFEVAKQRQKMMELEVGVSVIVVKLRGVLNIIEDKQNNNADNCNRELQFQISTGGYGQIGNRDLMGAQKLRHYFNIYQVNTQEIDQVPGILAEHTPHLISKRKQSKESESELIKKIKNLQSELTLKRKQLQQQKQRIANEQAIQAELQDQQLPSQRPMVNLNIQKYESKVFSVSKNFCSNEAIKNKNAQ